MIKGRVLGLLNRFQIFRIARRMSIASRYPNRQYRQILRWGFTSKENTNYTYYLKESNLVYLAHTIAYITKREYSEIFGYIKEAQSNEELKSHIIEAIKSSDQGSVADAEVRFGRRLGWYAFARAIKPRVIVETGVDKGLGSVLMCAAIEQNTKEGYKGRFYGTDINPSAGYLLSGKYKEYGEVLYGDSITTLSSFNKEIDLFINDSDHSEQYEYDEYKTVKPLLNEASIILGDNAHATSMLSKFSLENKRNFLFFKEAPLDHWYPGAGIGISFNER